MQSYIEEGLNIILHELILPSLKIIFNYFSFEKLYVNFKINLKFSLFFSIS